jgi:hypothetical protein
MSSKKIKLLIGTAILAALIAFVWFFFNTGKKGKVKLWEIYGGNFFFFNFKGR